MHLLLADTIWRHTYPFILLWALFHVSDHVTNKGHNYPVALMLPGENIKSIHSNGVVL